jgi:cyclic AMP-dependent transcription factor ATF-2
MTTSVLLQMPFQNHKPYDARNEKHRMASGLPSYEDTWMAQLREDKTSPFANFSMEPPVTHNGYSLPTNPQQRPSDSSNIPFPGALSQAPDQRYAFASGSDASANITPSAEFSSPSSWTPTNSTPRADIVPAISSFQGHFDQNVPVPLFYSEISAQPRRDSGNQKEEETSLSTTEPRSGRRRRSEYADPGSARAIYLEKNRKAASKCRSKQKMEQEKLVEDAREAERKNRWLKEEVEILQAELRNIKETVGRHANCPDRRMTQYLQREADRLAAAGMRPQYQ